MDRQAETKEHRYADREKCTALDKQQRLPCPAQRNQQESGRDQ